MKEETGRAAGEAAKKAKTIKIIAVVAIAVILVAALIVTKVIIPNNNYKAALALKDSGQYEEAIAAFETMGEYKDCVEQIELCHTGIKDDAYAAALALKDAGQYEEAIAGFEALGEYKDCAEQIELCHTGIKDDAYAAALALKDAGKYKQAFAEFTALGNYKDSTAQIADIQPELLKSAVVGDIVYFGAYEQDNDNSNGKEAVEWLVLDKQDDRILVISRYALDTKPYNTKETAITWAECTLRSWLNDEFINTAFSAEEQAMIPTVTVTADKNPEYSTQDKVFLLSISEVNRYFASNSARKCSATRYAKGQGAYVAGNDNSWWWLRSPGDDSDYAAFVYDDGYVIFFGDDVDYSARAVRPAMWINIES